MKRVDTFMYGLSSLSEDEMKITAGLAKVGGWNSGLHDSTAVDAADPTAFLVVNDSDQLIASLSRVMLGIVLGFIRLVEPSARPPLIDGPRCSGTRTTPTGWCPSPFASRSPRRRRCWSPPS